MCYILFISFEGVIGCGVVIVSMMKWWYLFSVCRVNFVF